MGRADRRLARLLPRRWTDWPRSLIEMLVVVFTIVMAIRALFLQPFKIPTGSMQPTLYGFHFEPASGPVTTRNPLAAFFAFANQSARQVNVTFADDLRPGEPYETREGALLSLGPLKLFEYTDVMFGDRTYRFPGDLDTVDKRVKHIKEGEGRPSFRKGETVAGDLLMGDHVFVDRVSYNFREPQRGDVAVFVTTNLHYWNGDDLGGLHFIKRLVGLPGDTLRITAGKLYVREPGAAEFRLMSAADSKAFGRLYSLKGGYRGYSHPTPAGPGNKRGGQYLLSDRDELALGPDEYFMMGDNSENSADSRYWGVVPRDHIIGRACWVWWPFSRRWGPVDRAEPLDFPSPPTVLRVPPPAPPPPPAPAPESAPADEPAAPPPPAETEP
jgi:signal peptidase I